jgi:hypothetical protein
MSDVRQMSRAASTMFRVLQANGAVTGVIMSAQMALPVPFMSWSPSLVSH